MPDDTIGRTRRRDQFRDDREPPVLDPGAVLADRYEVMEEVGRGAFAAVYRVWDLKLDIEKAIKVFPADLSVTEREALRQEARTQARVHSPNIVRLFDYVDSVPYPLLDMEYVGGGSLREKLGRKLPRRKALTYGLQIAQGLQTAHAMDIIHRDVKPANVLIDENDEAKLGDFGIADDLARGAQADNAGTDAYMAPELADGFTPSVRSDIFAFGVSLYEMLYGERPFPVGYDGHRSFTLPARLVRSRKPEDRILRRCLSASPEQRYESTAVLVENLESALKETENTPARQLVRIIYMANPLRLAPQNIRRELMALMALLALLAALAPFYMRTVERERKPEREITFEGAPLAVFVNLGRNPVNNLDHLRRGDHLQFRDRFDNPLFDYTYQGEDPFHLVVTRDSILINDTLVGRRIRSRSDLPLEPDLAYVSTEIPLSDADWSKQTHPDLNVRLGRMAPRQALTNIPEQTRYLNLSDNSIISSLRGVERLAHLRGLDVSGVDGLFLQGLENNDSLRTLDVSETRLHSSLPFLQLEQLERLDISQNELDDLSGLLKLEQLQSLAFDFNREAIEDIEPLFDLPNLTHISRTGSRIADPEMDKRLMELEEQLKALNPEERRTVEERVYRPRTVADRFVYILAILAMLAALALVARVMMLRLPRPSKQELDESKPDRADLRSELKDIDQMLHRGDICTPEDNNAAAAIRDLAQEHPTHPELRKRREAVVKAVRHKVKKHARRMEFEPAWMAVSATAQLLDDSRLHIMERKLRNQLTPDDDITFVRIKGGEFDMGDFAENALRSATPVHKVTLDDFQLSRVAVSNQQYCKFLNAKHRHREGLVEWINLSSPYCRITKDKNRYSVDPIYAAFPVIEVSWHGAQRFCEWIGGRLPTEAEWEYAARNGGAKNAYPTGADMHKSQANYLVDPEDDRWHSITPVRTFKPNKLGLFEMVGNVLEWCYDWFDADFYESSPKRNPIGPARGTLKVVRGGGWCFPKRHARTFYRGSAKPASRTNFISFRVARNG